MSLTETPMRTVAADPGRDATGHEANNFDLIRFLAASAVLYSHCFALTAKGGDEPLVRWTHGEFTFGGLAVRVFFVISGFLVTSSWLRNPHSSAFASARVLRIFPALAVALAYCVLAGLLTTSLSSADFLTHPDTWRYYWHNLALQTEFFLPGAFHTNPNPDAVNGSLWSLYYEVRAYIIVLVIGVFGLMRSRWLGTAAWLAAAALVALWPVAWGISVEHDWPVINASACFVGGALLALHPGAVRSRWLGGVAILAAVALPFTLGTPCSEATMDVLLVSSTISLAYFPAPALAHFGRHGDFSYGLFIYAYPTQQLIAWAGVRDNVYAMFALAFPATLALAAFSWHFVERPCRDLKRYFRRAGRTQGHVAVSSTSTPE